MWGTVWFKLLNLLDSKATTTSYNLEHFKQRVWIQKNVWKRAVLVTKWFYNSSIWMKKNMQILSEPFPTIVGNSQASKNGSLKMKILLPSQNFRLSYHRKTQKSSVKQFFKLLPFSISFLTDVSTNGPTQKVGSWNIIQFIHHRKRTNLSKNGTISKGNESSSNHWSSGNIRYTITSPTEFGAGCLVRDMWTRFRVVWRVV